MNSRAAKLFSALFCVILIFAASARIPASAQTKQTQTTQKGSTMTQHATGTFTPKITPQPADVKGLDPSLGRMSVEKTFQGDLDATSTAQMLTASTEVKGSGAYVAVERVTGKLHGRTGAFSLFHYGVMTRGVPELVIRLVPDSGTGELTGITGDFKIIIAPDGKHSYTFDYSLPNM